MYLKIFIIINIILLSFSACSKDNGVDLKEGKWSVTTTTAIEGMPFQMPPVTMTECLTHENYMPKQQQGDESKCKIFNKKIEGSTVSWEMKCPHSNSKTTIIYKHDTFSGEMKMQTDQEGGTVKMSTTMEGKYIEPCR